MRTRARLLASAALAATATPLLVIAPAAPAAALSCVGAEQVLADAEQVFTGRVQEVDGDHIEVVTEESWRGEPPQERVRLRVDLVEWSPWGSDGRDPGADDEGEVVWAFSTYRGEDGDLEVNACTVWPAHEVREDGLGSRAPEQPVRAPSGGATASGPAGAEAAAGGFPTVEVVTWAAAGGIAAVSTLGAAVVRRQRRRDAPS